MTPSPRRILIVRPTALGDVCRTVPVLASLRQAFPEAEIDWVVHERYSAAVASHPMLTEVVPFPRDTLARWWRGESGTAWRWFRSLRTRGYDLVLDAQGLGRSGLITWATRAPERVGFGDAGEFAWLGYTRRIARDATLHTVDAMLELVRAVGATPVADMRLYTPPADDAWWHERRPSSYVVLAPTSKWTSKRWPAERWGQLARRIVDEQDRTLVLVGAPGEEQQVRAMRATLAAASLVDLVGKTTVGQTMAVIANADSVIAHDSAPLHMAVGYGRPCLGLFGPTDPARVGPYAQPDAIVSASSPRPARYRASRLGNELMREIAVDEVFARWSGLPDAAPGREVSS